MPPLVKFVVQEVLDKLLEDAQRDWKALGQEPLLVTPLARPQRSCGADSRAHVARPQPNTAQTCLERAARRGPG